MVPFTTRHPHGAISVARMTEKPCSVFWLWWHSGWLVHWPEASPTLSCRDGLDNGGKCPESTQQGLDLLIPVLTTDLASKTLHDQTLSLSSWYTPHPGYISDGCHACHVHTASCTYDSHHLFFKPCAHPLFWFCSCFFLLPALPSPLKY